MIKTILPPFILLLLTLSFAAQAQTDTSSYDLGRVSIKKDFTQSITIKSTDLERFQFSDLADAINVWLYGTYTTTSNITYVVDGNIITDPNVYGIYDVDEITLMQNAIAQVSGAASGQQMVLIKLKTHRPGKQGVEAAAQTSLVNVANLSNNVPNGKSTTNIYDQFYVGAYKNTDIVSFGVSAGFQHDVLPFLLPSGGFSDTDPRHFERIKLNGYANAKLWTGTEATFGINYAPQSGGVGLNYVIPSTSGGVQGAESLKDNDVQHMVSLNLAINSMIVKGLTNKLSAAYNHYNYFEADSTRTNEMLSGQTQNGFLFTKASETMRNLLIRDNLTYHAQLGAFDFEPALNFSFRSVKDLTDEYAFEFVEDGSGAIGTGTPNVQTAEQASGYKINLYFLTPNVNIYYKKVIDLQAGFVYLLNHFNALNEDNDYHLYRMAPFVSATANVSNLWSDHGITFKIFASFSQQNALLQDPIASLLGFYTPTETVFAVDGQIETSGTPYVYGATVNPYEQFNSFQAGFTIGLFKNFFIDYNFRENYNEDIALVEEPSFFNDYTATYGYYFANFKMNRLGLNYNLTSNNFIWRTGFNVAEEKLGFAGHPPFDVSQYTSYINDGHRYSGGFTNRFAYKTFFAGLDILYQFGQRPLTLDGVDPEALVLPPHTNSVSLQSVYFGAKVKVPHLKYAEIYANTRNILQNNASDITDNRRFYGIGLKVGL